MIKENDITFLSKIFKKKAINPARGELTLTSHSSAT